MSKSKNNKKQDEAEKLRIEEISRTIVPTYNTQGKEVAEELLKEAHKIIAGWKK